MSGVELHVSRAGQQRYNVRASCALLHANVRASARTSRSARRKCLTFTRECVAMHVMHNSNAAVARGDKGSPQGFGLCNRNERMTFTGRNMQTAEVTKIAASKGAKLTAHTPASCPP